MAKRFKLRIARVLPSFQTCRSKDLIPSNPVPSIFHLSPVNPKPLDLTFPPPPSPPPIKHLVSVGCGLRSFSKSHRPIATASDQTPDFQWQKDDKWHVIAKVPSRRKKVSTLNSSYSDDEESSSIPSSKHGKKKNQNQTKKKLKKKKKKRTSSKSRSNVRFSTSSFDNSGCWFSSSDRECGFLHHQNEFLETETLVSSSRSFSDGYDDSSDFWPSLKPIEEQFTKKNPQLPSRKGSSKKAKKKTKTKTRQTELKACPSPETDSPARVSVFRRMVPCGAVVEGKVRESFAVVKRSDDPYEDFRRSMLEMILEKEMYDKGDLEQLLHCFLSLNSQAHHGVIVEVFSEIWETLFCNKQSSSPCRDGGTKAGL